MCPAVLKVVTYFTNVIACIACVWARSVLAICALSLISCYVEQMTVLLLPLDHDG